MGTGTDSAATNLDTDSRDTSGDTTESMAIDEAFCAQFETEQACAEATPDDAPLQCAYYDAAWAASRLVQTAEGPACIQLGLDYGDLGCHLVEYTPSACELAPPLEATEACEGREPPWLFWEVGSTGEEWAAEFALPCQFRPPGYQACWENPAPACWCTCHPPASCEDVLENGGLCEPTDTDGSESNTGTGADSGTSTGTDTTN